MIYCSLGGLCHSAQLLKINGLKKASYPFDWIFSNIKMVKHCIEDDFKTFLDKSQYSDYTTNTTLRENQCEHSIYGEMVFKGEHKVIFNHHNPLSSETDYAYLERCVDRFRELLKSEEPKTFVMFEYVKNLKLTIQQLLKAKQKYKAESERWMDKFYTQYPKSKLEI